MKKQVLIISIIGIFLLIQPLSAQTWEKVKRLTWNSGDSSRPSIDVDAGNNIHVVWHDDSTSNNEIYFKRSTNGGTSWTPKRLTYNSGSSYAPAIATASNNIHVVWYDNSSGNYEIYYKRSTNVGVTWGGAKRITWNSGRSSSPAIAVDSSNTIHVVWFDDTLGNDEIHYKRSTNGGVTWGGAKRLTWSSDSSRNPIMAIDSSNNIYVVWAEKTSEAIPGEIYFKKSTNGGTTWTGAKRLTWNSGESFGPSMAIDSGKYIHVVWFDYTPGNFEIYYKKSTNEGTTWTGAKRLTRNSGASFGPSVAIDSGKYIHVVWFDYTPGNSEIYYKRSTNGGASWTTKRLTWNSGWSSSPAIAVDSSNTIHVVWNDYTPGNYEIYYKRGIQ